MIKTNYKASNVSIMEDGLTQYARHGFGISKQRKEEEMKVMREVRIKTEKLETGDRIKISLPGEEHTATAIKYEGDGMLFLFDRYLDEARPMNRSDSTNGGYDASEMRKFLRELAETFPKKLRKRMVPFENGDMLRLLTITEMCGVDKDFNRCDGQIEWMKDRRHRIAYRKGKEYECGWTSTVVSGATFASVTWYGAALCYYASRAIGVRPAFKILYP